MRVQVTHYNEFNLCLATGESEIDTIPELIPQLHYIQNLLSSHAFTCKYPPSCFNLLVTPLKM